MFRYPYTKLVGFGILTVFTVVSGHAGAQTLPLCSGLSAPPISAPPIYITGSSALEPLMQALGPVLARTSDPATKFSLVYLSEGSCNGVGHITAVPPATGPITVSSSVQFTYYSSDYSGTGPGPKCRVDDFPTTGVPIDVGISDVFVEVCTGTTRPASVGDFLGPAQAMLFITHPNSSQVAITAEEAYLVFGFGMNSMVSPWLDELFYFTRPNTSGTKNLWAANIRVPVAKWKGVFMDASGTFGSAQVRDHVANSTDPEKTIGILGADVYDQGMTRQQVKALAFRGFGQYHAWWPDSTRTAFDKRNLRDGHYLGFGYAHLIATVDSSGVPTNSKAKLVIDVLLGNRTLTGVDTIQVVAQTAHLIPQCAMKVKRAAEGGDLASVTAADNPTPCHCYFEGLTSGGTPAGCTACPSGDSQCSGATPKCRNGFCEAR